MSMNHAYRHLDELPVVFPIFPLAGALLLPRGELPLNVFEQRYLAMVDDALKSHRIVDELAGTTPYRQCRADFSPFFVDFSPRAGEDQVDRDGVLRTLRDFADTN